MRNVGGQSVITLYHAFGTFVNSRISNNNMTGITAIESDFEFSWSQRDREQQKHRESWYHTVINWFHEMFGYL